MTSVGVVSPSLIVSPVVFLRFCRILRPTVVTILALLLAPLVLAQFPSAVNNDTRTPVPGSGHDYINMLSETVDPSNGSLSVHISTPVPPSRGITIPFSFDYSSGAVMQVQEGSTGWGSWGLTTIFGGAIDSGGWSYSIPELTANQPQVICYINGGGGSTLTTQISLSYIFTDPSGARHNLGLAHIPTLNPDCTYLQDLYSVSTGGDDFYGASLNQTSGAVTVVGVDGTVYNFSGASFGNGYGVNAWLSSTIEDRNGNVVTISEGSGGNITETDTAGRSAVSTSARAGTNGTVSIPGLSNAYTVTWETMAFGYGSQYEQIGNGPPACNWSTSGGGSGGVIKSIELPNQTYYNFAYDNYGLLSQITYPTGAVVSYTWNTPSSPNGVIDFLGVSQPGTQLECTYGYYAPMVTQRTVAFDGVHTALVQNFTYTTAYNTGVQQATVKTTVYSSSGSTNLGTFKTVYNYASTALGYSGPDEQVSFLKLNLPVEQTVQYYDYGQTNLLETVTKAWQDQFRLGCQLETHDGSGLRGTFYSYGPGLSLTAEEEYDYGQVTTSQCPQAAEGGPITAPAGATRETATTYQGVGNSSDRPCSVVTKDSSGNKAAETDYLYDGGTSVCGTAGTASVASASTPIQHDSAYAYTASPQPPRGNATSVTRQCLQSAPACSSGNPTTTYGYDETGQITSIKDPRGNTTQYSHADSYTSGTPPGQTNAYLTKITEPPTNGVNHIEKYGYAYASGEVTSSTDQNNQVTSYKYVDSLARLTETDYPDGGKTTLAYNDAAYNPSTPSPSVTTNKALTSSANLVSVTAMDGLGHAVETELTSDPGGTDYTVTTLDGLARPLYSYNPTRCNPPTTNCGTETTWGYSTYTYDALGRTKNVAEPDGSAVSTSYSGNTTTVTDEVGNERTTTTDAFGRIIAVSEAPNVTGYNFTTQYQYDALNNLLCAVQQGTSTGTLSTCAAAPASWRPRSFAYDSLSRLVTAANPESGTVTYAYDLNGNVASKTAPLENQTGTSTVQTTYLYDALNRLTKKSYNDGLTPTLQFAYDAATLAGCTEAPPALTDTYPIGRRTSMCDGSGGTSWSHDKLGRILIPRRQVASASPHELTYSYNLDGSLATQNDGGGGKIITYTTGGAGRPLAAEDASGNMFVKSAAYAPFGGLASMINGYTSSFAGITTTNQYNSRLQPSVLSASTSAGTVFSQSYGYGTSGHDNGNVYQIVNNLNNARTQNFTYDPLNRILKAASQATSGTYCWGQNFTIDPWGNLYQITASQCSAPSLTQTPNTNNQIVGFCYDAAGNLLDEIACPSGNHTFVYNAEGQLLYTAGYSYLYDGDGQRVAKCTSTGQSSTCPTSSTGTTYLRNLGNESVLETDLSGNVQNEYIFFNGSRLVRSEPSGALHYYFHNHLATTEVVTNARGAVPPQQDVDYTPYGIVIDGTPSEHYLFTGKERDSESGLDMFGARYYGSSLGRFMTPDWAAKPITVPYANFGNPQSLNLYSYVTNNPLTLLDDDGHDIIYAAGLQNAQLVKDSVQAILANPNTSANLSGYVGPNNPNLTIQSGDLSAGDTRTVSPDGQTVTTTTVQGNTAPDIQTTSGSSTFNGVTTTEPAVTTLTGATITIDNRTSKGDTPGVMVHESVHAGEAKANPGQFSKDAAAEKSLPHDQRPQEQRANAAQKAFGNEIKKEVKQIQKDRKKDDQ